MSAIWDLGLLIAEFVRATNIRNCKKRQMELKRSKLKKRLRKKYHLGEYQEYGFEIYCQLKSGLSENEFDRFYDDFIGKVEAETLTFGGGGRENWEGFIASARNYGSPTEKQRFELGEWLKKRAEVETVKMSELQDAWNK